MTVIRRYCTCGAALHARSTPASTAETLADQFDRYHRAVGCEPTTAEGASRARRAEEARILAEMENGDQPTSVLDDWSDVTHDGLMAPPASTESDQDGRTRSQVPREAQRRSERAER